MPDVTMPNGDIVSFPDDMPQEQIKSLIVGKFPELGKQQPQQLPLQPQQQDPTMLEEIGARGRGLSRAMLGGSFMDELLAVPATVGTSAYRAYQGQPLQVLDDYQSNLANLGQSMRRDEEIAPYTSLVGTLAGDIKTGLGAAKLGTKALPQIGSIAKSKPVLTASGIGGVSGGVYGFGASEKPIQERGNDAITGAGLGLALGGGLAAAAPLTQRVMNLIGKKRGQDVVVKTAKDVVSPEYATQTQRGELLDLTKGQATQDPKIQALEKSALKGGLGQGVDSAQDIAMRAQEAQQSQIRGVVGGMAEGGEEALGQAAKTLDQSYKAIKSQVNKAYDDARITQGVYISQSPIDEIFKPQVDAIIKSKGFDISDFGADSKKVINQIKDSGFYNGKKVTAQNLEKMEFWRRRASRLANGLSKNPEKQAEGMALKSIIDSYDNFMAKLPEDVLMSGDEEALQAINKARGLRKTQGVLFERNKVIRDIVQNKDLTNEELANMVLTGMKSSEKIGKGAGRNVKYAIKAVPESVRPQFKENLKRGTMARIMSKSEGSTLIGGQSILEPHKLKKELDNILSNKTFVNEVFDKDDISMLTALSNDLKKINSVQAGADNYSNTAYAIMRFFENIPWIGSPVASVTRPVGNVQSKKAAQEAFSPIYGELKSAARGKAQRYNALTGGALSAQIEGNNNE